MQQLTHVEETNGRGRMFLDDGVRSFRDGIHRMLTLLDGDARWSYTLARAPHGKDIDEIGPDWPRSFIQAGGAADRIAIEVRYLEDDDNERQYAVGKPGGQYIGDPSETVVIGGNEFQVYPNEVFTADEATDVFYGYFQTDRVPDQYPLRWLDFSEYE